MSVDHERRDLPEKLPQDARDIGRQRRLVEGAIHELHPPVAGALIDREGHVAHPQPRMPALGDVPRRPAEPADEKIAQPLFGTGEIIGRIHGPQHLVAWDLRVERADEAREAVFADTRVDLFLRQIHNSSMPDDAPKSAYELAMERLRRKDAEAGVEERALTDEQKAEIAEIRRVYSAKVAEAEILHKSKPMTTFDPEERALAEQGHRRDLERLRDDQDRKLAQVRDR